MIKKALQKLYVRLSLAFFFSFLIVGIFSAVLFIYASRAHQQEITQIMHRELAEHVVHHYLLFNKGEPDLKAAKQTFHDLMILGPNFEFYLLDQSGNILSFSAKPDKIKLKSIDLNPVREFLSLTKIERPIQGSDPRSFTNRKIFSVAPIINDDKTVGYLYVILGSEIYDKIAEALFDSKILRLGLAVFTAGLIFSLSATLFFTGWLTAPLSKLTYQVRQVLASGFTKHNIKSTAEPLSQWRDDCENEMHILGSAFKDVLEKLEEQYQNVITIDELRKELLSHISHDLRTPLASLLGYLETWEINRNNVSETDAEEYIFTAKKNAQKISNLIEQLFELAHLDSGNVQVSIEQFSIAELVQDVLQKLSISAKEKDIKLDVTPHNSALKVVGDIEKLERVFTNLVENAIRHTNKGGSILIRLSEKSRLVAVEVSDDGIGIPKDDLPHIFEPHFKAGNSVRENTAHGGLGLAITKKLLDLHKSTIKVKSNVNEGTTFAFTLPCAE